jgi:hypothetical protein
LNTQIRGLQLRDAFFGDGLKRNAGDENIAEIALKANDGLKIDTAELTIAYDNATIGIISDELAVKDEGITEVKLDINTAAGEAVDGQVLYWNNGAGKLDYKDIDVDFVSDDDVKFQNESASCDGLETDFTLDSTPVTNSVQIYLNGLIQEEGSGKDYTLSGTTVSFAIAPETNDILLIHYIAITA